MTDHGKIITVKLDEITAKRLALFCKRTIIERVGPFAADEAEAQKMMDALDTLGEALRDQEPASGGDSHDLDDDFFYPVFHET